MPNDNKRYDMLDNSQRDEELRLKKIRQGIIKDTENEQYLKEKKEREETPLSFKEKLINFWYHYKWTVLVLSVILVSSAFFTYQAFTAERYDTTIMLCTENTYSDEAVSSVSKAFGQYIPDIDGDGKINVAVFQANYQPISGDDYSGYQTAMQSRIMAELADGENCIFILEKNILAPLVEKGVFKALDEKNGEKIYALPLKDCEILSDKSFDKLRDNAYVAVRIYKKGTDKEAYEAQLNAVLEICK